MFTDIQIKKKIFLQNLIHFFAKYRCQQQPHSNCGTPHEGNPPSYPRTHESLPIPSVGTPPSVSVPSSPLPNLNSVQPSSVTSMGAEQTVMLPMLSSSPQRPSSVNLPQTSPNLLLDHQPKSNNSNAPLANHMSTSSSSSVSSSISPLKVPDDHNCQPQSHQTNNTPFVSLKRPVLLSIDADVEPENDDLALEILYSYTAMDSWLSHPVKRIKTELIEVNPKSPIHSEISSTYHHQHHQHNQQNTDSYYQQEQQSHQRLKQELPDIKEEINDPLTNCLLQVQTPPNSVKSITQNDDILPTLQCNIKNASINNHNNNNISILRPEELSKMFPTPPSLEHNAMTSPCSGTLLDSMGAEIQQTILGDQQQRLSNSNSTNNTTNSNCNQFEDDSPNMLTPTTVSDDQPSYVFKPTLLCKIIDSTKYSPLSNFSNNEPLSLFIPNHSIYKPSWLMMAADKSKPKLINNLHHQNKLNMLPLAPPALPQRSPLTPFGMQPRHTSGVGAGAGSGGNSMMMTYSQQHQHQHHPHTNNFNNHATFRPPPPPYSPANSTHSSHSSYLLSQPQHLHQSHLHQPQPQQFQSRIPEINSLTINILLGDTALNQFRDHNFDSCSLCVCNAGQKVVGNIRGADAAMYLTPSQLNSSTSVTSSSSSNMVTTTSQSQFYHHNNNNLNQSPMYCSSTNCNVNHSQQLFHYSGGMMFQNAAANLHSPHHNHNHNQHHQHPHQHHHGPQSNASTSTANSTANANSNTSGAVEEESIRCTCGFSAIMNRKLSHKCGLFYEDELEIAGIADNPSELKQRSLITILMSLFSVDNSTNSFESTAIAANREQLLDPVPHSIIELIREQCFMLQSMSNSLHRAARLNSYRQRHKFARYSSTINVLEFNDNNDVVLFVLEQLVRQFEQQQYYQNRLFF